MTASTDSNTDHDTPGEKAELELQGEANAVERPAPAAADTERLARVVEALLLAADQPLTLDQLVRLVADLPGAMDSGASAPGKRELRLALEKLDQRLAESAAEVKEVASGWRIQVRADYAEVVSRLWQEKPPRMSRAMLETLALVVYRQPITRGEIEEIRGVSVSSNIIKTLLERGWIREVGVKETPGRPALYGTTAQLLDDLNLKTLDQLPDLPAVKDLEQLEAALGQLAGLPALPVAEEAHDEPVRESPADDEAGVTLH